MIIGFTRSSYTIVAATTIPQYLIMVYTSYVYPCAWRGTVTSFTHIGGVNVVSRFCVIVATGTGAGLSLEIGVVDGRPPIRCIVASTTILCRYNVTNMFTGGYCSIVTRLASALHLIVVNS